MRLILTALIFLAGMFDLYLGASFLLTPTTAATGFGLSPLGAQGLSTLRADFTAFFGLVAVCMMVGAWRRNGDLLLIPAALMGTAVTVRGLSLAIDGAYAGWPIPMGVELFHVVLLLAARRLLPHHTVEQLAA